MAQGEVLERLYYIPGLTTSEIAVVLDLSTQAVGNSISRLKKYGWVVGVKNRTSIRYELTPKGRDFAERLYL